MIPNIHMGRVNQTITSHNEERGRARNGTSEKSNTNNQTNKGVAKAPRDTTVLYVVNSM